MSGGQDPNDSFNQAMLGTGEYKPTMISVDDSLLYGLRLAIKKAEDHAKQLLHDSKSSPSQDTMKESIWRYELMKHISEFKYLQDNLNFILGIKEVNPND